MRKSIYKRQSERRERYSKAAATGLQNLKGLNGVTRLTGWKDGSGNITRPGNTERIPHFICTTPIHSNCRRAWEIVPEGKKTGCKYRCAVISRQAVIGPMTWGKQDGLRGWGRTYKNINTQASIGRSCEQRGEVNPWSKPSVYREHTWTLENLRWPVQTDPVDRRRGGGQEIIHT